MIYTKQEKDLMSNEVAQRLCMCQPTIRKWIDDKNLHDIAYTIASRDGKTMNKYAQEIFKYSQKTIWTLS